MSRSRYNTLPAMCAMFACMVIFLALAPVTANAQDKDEIYWCPMRGNPCGIDDYEGAGKCDDCHMPLVLKSSMQKLTAQPELTLGVVLYNDFELLDVFGPVEMFGNVSLIKVVMIAEKAGDVKSTQGPTVKADYGFDDAPKIDLLLVPGGFGTIPELENQKLLDWLKDRSSKAKITASVCSGSALLAKAGILDGKRATSNKQFFDLATAQSDKVDWVWEARWVDDDDVVTSSGVSAGIDMALHLIERLYGSEVAEGIAIATEYQWHRDSTVDPFADLIERN